jgi:hypothetical protein
MVFMHWPAFAAALLTSAIALVFHVVPGAWCESPNVRGVAAIFVFLVLVAYLVFVDDERRPKVGALHRIVFGAVCGVAIASIYSSSSAGFALGALAGGTLGYIGIHWAKYVQF